VSSDDRNVRLRRRPLAAVRDGETGADGGVLVSAVREHGLRGDSPDMAVQSHARAAEQQQQRAAVGLARALRRRALVWVLLGADAVRPLEPRVSSRLPGQALAKVTIHHGGNLLRELPNYRLFSCSEILVISISSELWNVS
jgi:hypothetical protein